MLSYPSGMTVSSRALNTLTDALRAQRNQRATRWRKLSAGRQALLVVAYLRKGETYADLACGFGIGTSTVYRYIREAFDAARGDGPDPGAGDRGRPPQGVRDPRRHPAADRPGRHDLGPGSGVLLRETQGPRAERAGHRRPGRHGWCGSHRALPGARHDMGAAREHGIIDALADAEIPAVADTAYQGAGPMVAVPQRRRRLDPDTGRYRRLSRNQKEVNAAHARRRGPGERVNAAAEELADPAQDPLLPESGPRARRRSSDPHDRRARDQVGKGSVPRSPGKCH